ncbi:16S rRNA (guanine(527)-N(7))-methyltransferase RsmG [Edaphobacter paludis]|uniref:Ribosomal RNA small subunit methyltransferase G n=1 Tax=Edaphobacter paludis TaxID=3035702 RepID=A0AAU7D688_9BACT
MATLSESSIADLLQPYLIVPASILPQLSTYLDLLLKWNARTNLTAIRDPEEIVRRHFGESLFAARHLDPKIPTLLDLGSGAGFPGLPIAILCPEIQATLAESQNKKASFLREVIRTLGLSTEVWANRAELLPSTRQFDTVTLRAVDDMAAAVTAAASRAIRQVVVLTSEANAPVLSDFPDQSRISIPESRDRILLTASRH